MSALARMARRAAWRVGRRLYCAARGEPARNAPETNGELDAVRRVIAANHAAPVLTLLDVGANVGDWARPVLAGMAPERRTAEGLRLHLFEPTPAVRTRLAATMRDTPGGGLARIEACALSDETGTARLAVNSDTGGTNSLVSDQAVALRVEEVERKTLADFAAGAGLAHIHFMKIDTEGHDLFVLKGARPLLAAGRIDVAQFEYNHRWIAARAFLKDVFDLIEGLPYALARERPHAIETFDAWHPELERFFEANYLLVRKPALAWFSVRAGRFDISNTYA